MYDEETEEIEDAVSSVDLMAEVLHQIYSKVHDQVDAELMRLSEEELRIMKIIYSDQLTYPIHEHISHLLEGVGSGETLH
jgi:pyruvate/2-oxoglutarate/acetoin dehydrogenase E1 component